jgi:hypothetical protein
MGLQPIPGRTFSESERFPRSASVIIIIGYELLQRKFPGYPNIIGKAHAHSARRHCPSSLALCVPE